MVTPTRAEHRPQFHPKEPAPSAAWLWPKGHIFPEMGACAHAPAAVRTYVREMLRVWDLPGLTENAELVASEITANAVTALTDPETIDEEHPQGLPRMIGDRIATITVRLRTDDVYLLIEVWDLAEGMPEHKDAALDDESGRGLAIVGALCEAYGCEPRKGGGKSVWALLKKPSVPGGRQRHQEERQ
ncbi:MAG: ATP-binding protein [Streptosporangiales bacterium]|nr:ATP-binding protein [Streptosporangiales bacterium]